MDEIIIYAVIGIGYLIFQGMRANAERKKKEAQMAQNTAPQPVSKPQPLQQSQRKTPQTPTQSQSQQDQVRDIFKKLGMEEFLGNETEGENKTTRPKVQTYDETSFPTEVEKSKKQHFSEDKLVSEYEKTQKTGKQATHHAHSYDDGEKIAKHNDERDNMEKLYKIKGSKVVKETKLANLNDPEKAKRHPILGAITNPGKLREAIIIMELMKKPDY